MIARGDAWQVHNCGSSNWATGDIFEGPKSATAGRQNGNEKQQRVAFSDTIQCQLVFPTQAVASRLTVEGRFSFSNCVFTPLLGCKEAVAVQLVQKMGVEGRKGTANKVSL